MPSNLTTKVYTFIWSKKDRLRNAEIVFVALAPDKWKFNMCSFVGCGNFYDLDDWEFLGLLADEIKSLCKKEGVIFDRTLNS